METTTRDAVLGTCVHLDPHPVVHMAIESILARLGIAHTATTSPTAALRAVYLQRPDLFVIEPALPPSASIDGLDCIRLATKTDCRIVVVAFSARDDDVFRAALARAGVAAFVPKTVSLRSLEAALSDALERARCGDEPPTSTLTGREREILVLVAQHYTNREVAHALWLSRDTVKFHLANVYRKLDVDGRAGAARWARRHGLVEEAPASAMRS